MSFHSFFLFYVVENLFGVNLCFYLLRSENLLNDAFLVDEICGAQGTHVFLSTHGFLAPGTELLKQCGVNVGDEWEGKFVFVNELLMACGRVLADTNDGITSLLQLIVVVLEGT